LVGLAFASQFYLSSNLIGRSITWNEAISISLGDWYVWAVLSLPILWLARRYPPEGPSRWRTAAIHLGAALVLSLAYVVLRSAVGVANSWLLGESVTFGDVFRPLLLRTYPFNLLMYGVVVAVSHSLDYYRKYHERSVQAVELEKHLAEARLHALLNQLKPHFLFNTLNGIASLMHSDIEAADKMLVRLSDLLRRTMRQTGSPRALLRDEISFVERYLEIEKIRFRDRLAVVIAIDEEALEAQVPSLILQPIVENAVRHGIEPHARPGRIELRGARVGGELVLTVVDNGDGIPAGGFAREGIGLANSRARLAELYGPAHRLVLENVKAGGLCARLAIPFSTQTP
jgi:signal transduction histidine kinase